MTSFLAVTDQRFCGVKVVGLESSKNCSVWGLLTLCKVHVYCEREDELGQPSEWVEHFWHSVHSGPCSRGYCPKWTKSRWAESLIVEWVIIPCHGSRQQDESLSLTT